MSNNLYTKTNYISDIKYIKDTIITEYDIKSAGLNILYDLGKFSKEQYIQLSNMNKLERNIFIGKLLRNNKELNRELSEGFKLARKIFFELNNIEEHEVLSIKKDAIFIIGRKCRNLQISNNVRFEEQKTYDTYIKILNYEHYINLELDFIDVKGYQKEVKEHHEIYFFKFLKECLWEDKKKDKTDLYKKLLLFKDALINYRLDVGFYYDFADSGYLINSFSFNFILDEFDDAYKKNEIDYDMALRYLNDLIYTLL